MSLGLIDRSKQTGLYTATEDSWRLRKKRDCTIYVSKTKVLISCMVTTQLICTFVFTHAKSRFSHDAAHLEEI